MKAIRPALLLAALLLALPASAADGSRPSYADDRAEIENLQARYMFALDFKDADTYAATFAEDGSLDFGLGEIKGRQAIHDLIAKMRADWEAKLAADTSGVRPFAGRHSISNVVLKIDGDRATGRAYWFHMSNESPDRAKSQLNAFGHYEDELVRVHGQWLFKKRKICNELVPAWVGPTKNPAW